MSQRLIRRPCHNRAYLGILRQAWNTRGQDPEGPGATLERFCNNVPKGSTAPDGEKPFDQLQAKHIRLRRDALVATPEAANTMLKAIKQVFKFAVQYEHPDRNPAADVEPLKSKGDGYDSWTLEEIEKFESVHPVGTTARLALALALYTGQRRSDLVKFGK